MQNINININIHPEYFTILHIDYRILAQRAPFFGKGLIKLRRRDDL